MSEMPKNLVQTEGTLYPSLEHLAGQSVITCPRPVSLSEL